MMGRMKDIVNTAPAPVAAVLYFVEFVPDEILILSRPNQRCLASFSLLSHVDATPNFVLPRTRSCLVIMYSLILLVYSSVHCAREQ
jgi:hypothetical protein